MRVLMISWEYPPNLVGGLGRHVAELVPVLVEQAVEVHVVTPTAEIAQAVKTEESGVVVHRVYTPSLNSVANIYDRALLVNQQLEKYIVQIVNNQDLTYDLIHVHDWLTSFSGLALQKKLNYPLVATIHATERGRGRGYISNDLQWAIDGAERDLIEQADQIIVCSHYMSYEVQSFFHTPVTRLDVVPNGVNIPDLLDGSTPEQLSALRGRYISPNDQIVFTVGRLVYQKGVHRLIEAVPQILDQYSQTHFIIAGKGPEADNLKHLAEALGVLDRVHFVGFISDAVRNQFYQIATCAIFPSLYEPFGIVALEAMALNCPVVASEVGGLAEVVRHTDTGITIYPDNSESAAWGILHILAHPDLVQTYVRNARQSVEQLFNWDRVARLTRAVYRRVLEHHPAKQEFS